MKDKSQKVLLIPIIVMIIGIAFFVFIKINKPAPVKVEKKEETLQLDVPFAFENTPLIAEFENSITDQNLKANFSLYEADPTNQYFPSNNLAKEISKILDLNQADENSWRNEIYTVTYLPSDFYIRIKIKPATSKKIVLNEERVLDKAEQTLKTLNIWPFTNKQFENQIDIFQKANIEGTMAKIILREELNNYPVYTNILDNGEIYMEFNEAGEATEIRYFYIPIKKKEAQIETKSAEEFTKSIETGEFKKLDEFIDFTKIKVEEIENIYYSSPLSNFVQPVFLVKGQNEFGEEIEIIIPALKEISYK